MWKYKEYNKKQKPTESITLSDITASSAGERRKGFQTSWIGPVLLAWLLAGSILAGFLNMFRIPAWIPLLLLLLALWVLVFNALFERRPKVCLLGFGLLTGAVIILTAVFSGAVTDSALAVVNQATERIKEVHPYLYTQYETGLSAALGGRATFASLAVFSYFLALLAAVWVRVANRILSALCTAGSVVLFLLLGFSPDLPYLLWLYLALALTFLLWQYSADHIWRQLSMMGSVILVCLIFTGAVVAPLSLVSDGSKPGWLQSAEQVAKRQMDYLRYGGKNTGMPEGDFTTLGALDLSDDPALTLTMQKPDSYYLRGFVGETYTGSGWESLDAKKLYQNGDLFYWLHQDGFFGQSQLKHSAEVSGVLETAAAGNTSSQAVPDGAAWKEGFSDGTLTVRTEGASREYIYAPYEFSSSESGLLDAKIIGDLCLSSTGLWGRDEYSMKASSNQVKKHPTIAAALEEEEGTGSAADDYLKIEGYYNDYVYEAYTELSDETRWLISGFLGSYEVPEGSRHADYREAKDKIISWLTENTTYREDMPVRIVDRDFLDEFLTVTRTGYSVHYATAGAEMFRYFGIPARYVEGYLVTPEDRAHIKAGRAFVLDGTHAHAWVEYYQDGVGWIPFEVTPSYMKIMEQADIYEYTSTESGGKSSEEEQQSSGEQSSQVEQQIPPIDEPSVNIPEELKNNIFNILLLLLLAALILFLIWFIRKRRAVAKRKLLFNSEDYSLAIRIMFDYLMDVLIAYGMKGKNQSLYQYAPGIGRKFSSERGCEYSRFVDLRQEAVYSCHPMTKEERDGVRRVLEATMADVKKGSNLFKRFKYWAVDFL